jgi:hypothetical protein
MTLISLCMDGIFYESLHIQSVLTAGTRISSCYYTGAVSFFTRFSLMKCRYSSVLGGSAKQRKATWLRPSLRSRRTTPLPLDEFFTKYDILGFFEMCRKSLHLTLARKAVTYIIQFIRDSISSNCQCEKYFR